MGIDNIIHGFHVAITPFNLMMAVVGISLGTIIGVLPGLGGANGVAILLPLTFRMPPTSASILLTSLYWGALVGGDDVRRLSIGQTGEGRSGAHRGVFVILRWSPLRDGPDHFFRAGPGRGCAEVRTARVLCDSAAHLLELRRLGGREPAQVTRLNRPWIYPRCGRFGHCNRAASSHLRTHPADDRV